MYIVIKKQNAQKAYCYINCCFIICRFIYFRFSQSYGLRHSINITHGVASGDVTNSSSIIWSRANESAIMNLEYSNNKNMQTPVLVTQPVNQSSDFTGHIKIDNLNPDTMYFYRIWFSGNNSSTNASIHSSYINGTFKTAP
jgi:alkaline phosphatase D